MNRNAKSLVAELPAARQQMRTLTRRSFAVGGIAALAGAAGLTWLHATSDDDGIPWPLRRALEFNERAARGFFSHTRLAPEFSVSRARMPRANGHVGLAVAPDLAAWRLNVTSEAAGARPLELSLEDLHRLPRVEITTELKCIEGWSEIVHWAGTRLSDFASHYRLARRDGQEIDDANSRQLLDFVGLETPDGEYYVGLDMPSALHPQTLLCYEMNGNPLTPEHGAPLRLVIPVKYGIKHLKRIGRIVFTDARPRDYWAERGYDWYAGH